MIAYFFADRKPTDVDSLEKLAALGLGYAFDVMPTVQQVLRGGPGDSAGVSISTTPLAAKVAGQEWEEHGTVDDCWIGYPADLKPADLKRETWEDVPSYHIKDWVIPIARMWATCELATSTLPKRLNFKAGEFCPGPVVERYKRLEEIGTEIVEVILSEQMPDNHFELACEVCSMVYRVGPQEFAKIGPVEYSHQSSFNYLSMVADLPGWHALMDSQKKSTSPMPE